MPILFSLLSVVTSGLKPRAEKRCPPARTNPMSLPFLYEIQETAMLFSTHQTVLYVRFKPQWLSVRVVRAGICVGQFEDIAQVAVRVKSNGKREIVALGEEAEPAALLGKDVWVITGFNHPRVVFGNFEDTVLVLEQFARRAYNNRFLLFKPRLLMHPLMALEGGLADVEVRGLMHLGLKVMARQVEVLNLPDALNDAEINAFSWSSVTLQSTPEQNRLSHR